MSKQDTRLTIEQFTKQALPFANSAVVRDDDVLDRILRFADLAPDDQALDVACGPGLLVRALAPRVHHATGVDLTPAMLDQAKQLQRQKGLANVTWIESDVINLPFPTASFSLVTSRYSFHHFAKTHIVLKEMVRVCKPGGRVIVVDIAPEESKAEEFNRIERLRDPSHTRALTEQEFRRLFSQAGIPTQFVEKFRITGDLNSLLARSFPLEGDADKVHAAFESALTDDIFDVCPTKDSDDKIRYSFPIILLKAIKPPSVSARI